MQFTLGGAQFIKGLRTTRVMSDTKAPGQVFSSVWIAAKVNPEDADRGAVAFSATDRYIYGTVIRTATVTGASGSAGMALPSTLVGTLLKVLTAKHTYEVTLSPPIADGDAPEFGIKDLTRTGWNTGTWTRVPSSRRHFTTARPRAPPPPVTTAST